MRSVGADDIHRLLDYPSLVAALREMFRAGCEVPLRHHHTILAPDSNAAPGTLLLMPAWQNGRSLGTPSREREVVDSRSAYGTDGREGR